MTGTRERIQQVALELFLKHGYDKTSLREIAERLDVTKAALYYHFKTKDDILASYFADFGQHIADLIEWGRSRPAGPRTRREILRRYMDIMVGHHEMIRFLHENQPTMRRLEGKHEFKKRMSALHELMYDPGAGLEARVRAFQALMTVHTSWFVFFEQVIPGERSELRDAALSVAMGMLRTNELQAASAADPQVDRMATTLYAAVEDVLAANGESAA